MWGTDRITSVSARFLRSALDYIYYKLRSIITNSYYQLHCPYETFSFSEILVCVGRTISSYMGTGSPDTEVGDDFPLFCMWCRYMLAKYMTPFFS